MIAVVASAVFFACIAFIGTYLSRIACAGVTPADDGPVSARPPYAALIVAAALLGGLLVAIGTPAVEVGIAAIVVFALVACWCSDAICGIVPDVFTLAPLAALLLFGLAQRDWGIIFSAAIAFVPFAAAAFFSRGYGMGWGDAKLVALTGAALGAPLAVLTLAVACAAAVIGHRLTGSRRGPIAFAPYIAALTGVALPLGLTH